MKFLLMSVVAVTFTFCTQALAVTVTEVACEDKQIETKKENIRGMLHRVHHYFHGSNPDCTEEFALSKAEESLRAWQEKGYELFGKIAIEGKSKVFEDVHNQTQDGPKRMNEITQKTYSFVFDVIYKLEESKSKD